MMSCTGNRTGWENDAVGRSSARPRLPLPTGFDWAATRAWMAGGQRAPLKQPHTGRGCLPVRWAGSPCLALSTMRTHTNSYTHANTHTHTHTRPYPHTHTHTRVHTHHTSAQSWARRAPWPPSWRPATQPGRRGRPRACAAPAFGCGRPPASHPSAQQVAAAARGCSC